MSPPRMKLRCLDQGPMVRCRDKNKKSTGGRPPRKLLATSARRSLIHRPSRHELQVMKRREAYLLAAKEALEQEEQKVIEEALKDMQLPDAKEEKTTEPGMIDQTDAKSSSEENYNGDKKLEGSNNGSAAPISSMMEPMQ